MSTSNTVTAYKISNPNGLNGRAWDREYPTVEEAAEAIRHAYQWTDIVVGGWFADRIGTDDNHRVSVSSCCAYETEADRDRDGDGSNAPWITRV